MSVVTILNVTWNVATQNKEPFPSLIPILEPSKDIPDFVVFGFQELQSQQTAPFSKYSSFNYNLNAVDKTMKPWIDILLDDLETQFHVPFQFICSGHLVAIGLVILVNSKMSYLLRDIWTGSIGTGLCGVYGNKGAVAIGIDLTLSNGSHGSICFISAHLGPHEGEPYFIWRNNEVYSIFQTLFLSDKSYKKARLLQDHDALFFLGDLNYRLKGEKLGGIYGKKESGHSYRKLVRAQIDEWIQSNDIASLLSRDELLYARMELNAPPLDSFEEAPIEFLPSYKLNVKNLQHANDLQGLYSKKRHPAYCDRILFKGKKSDIECLLYSAIADLGWSDHQPVMGLFKMDCAAPGIFPHRPYRELLMLTAYSRLWRFVEINGYRLLILIFLIFLYLVFKE